MIHHQEEELSGKTLCIINSLVSFSSLEINTTLQHCRHNVQHKNVTDLTLAGDASMPNFYIYFSF